ncbi:MAG: hypothetical protein HC795_05585 [Coleofasciculaceae cyanobacterium RL_1_1]|nr:hypothetical protein [Coleofasciculaceae cyanobacterium RL_1_1]
MLISELAYVVLSLFPHHETSILCPPRDRSSDDRLDRHTDRPAHPTRSRL